MYAWSDDFQELFAQLQSVADKFWKVVDESALSLVVDVEGGDDPVKTFKLLRDKHAASLETCLTLHRFSQDLAKKVDDFSGKVDSFQGDIVGSAMNCGLRRLPDELLVDILDRAANSIKSSVRLSHVCKRFRTIVPVLSKYWSGYTLESLFPSSVDDIWLSNHWTGFILESHLPPSIIRALIHRHGDAPVKAFIACDDKGILPSDSVKAIFGAMTRFEELHIEDLTRHSAAELCSYLDACTMPQLHTLTIYTALDDDDIPSLAFPGRCHMPSLRTLYSYVMPDHYLSRNLHECDLDVPTNGISLKLLLDFLSSASELKKLSITFDDGFADQELTESSESIALPSLTSLEFSDVDSTKTIDACRRFMEKIVPFSTQCLILSSSYANVDPAPLLDYIQDKLSIEQLALRERLAGEAISWWTRQPERLPPPNIQLLSFESSKLDPRGVLHLKDRLVADGRCEVRFKFFSCKGMKNGVYKLPDVHTAVRQ